MATVLAFQRAAAAAAAVAAAKVAPTVPTAALPPLVVEDEDEGATPPAAAAAVVAVAAEAEVAVEEVPIATSAARLGIGQATAQRVTRSRVVVDGVEADTVVPAVAEAPAAAVVAEVEAAVAVAATSASSAASRGIGPATVPMASAGRLGLWRGYSGESIMSVLVPTVLHSEHVPGDYFSICARRMRRALPLSGTRAIFPPRGQWPCTHLFF
jgi:hypothetical protein